MDVSHFGISRHALTPLLAAEVLSSVDGDDDEDSRSTGVTDPGCLLRARLVLSTFSSEALILTQLNEVSITDPHCSDEETGTRAQDHPASEQ